MSLQLFFKRLALGACLFCLCAASPHKASAKEGIIVDLARHDIPISTGFDGARVLLFGVSEGKGNILVRVRGPEQDYDVTRKRRVSGIWLAGARKRVLSAPAFYHILTSSTMHKQDLSEDLRQRNHLELRYLDLRTEGLSAGSNLTDDAEFIAAFVRSQQRKGLYGENYDAVERMGSSLFRATLLLPPGLPTGTYTVETFLVREGRLSSAQVTPLFVRRSGGGALVFEFAERFGFLYGLFAVVLALGLGGLAFLLFRD